MEYRPAPRLAPALQPPTPPSADTKYFKQFKSIFVKEFAPITSIHFSPAAPHRFAVTSATRVQVYNPKTQTVAKTISRFKDVARSGQIRADGKLVVAGDDSGLIQVFDINSRAILRTMRTHQQPVHVTKFHTLDSTRLLSCSDDATVVLHDIPSQTALHTFTSHTDYVRSGAPSPSSPHLLLSGSYDSTLRLWDVRQPDTSGAAITMVHGGAPVEDVIFLPGGEGVVSAGGPIIRVWDLLAGGRCRRALSNHQKTVTSLAVDGDERRLLTGGLDQMVKVYDLESFRVTHTMRFPAPVLSLAISPDNLHLAAGLSDGTLALRRRTAKANEASTKAARKAALHSGAYEFLQEAGGGAGPTVSATGALGVDEFKVEAVRRRRLKDYDRLLKSFKYSAALDAVLRKQTPPATTFSLLHELLHRDGLKTALSGRDDVSLEPVLALLVKHITDPRFADLACTVAGVVLDIYGTVAGQSALIDTLLGRLRKKIEDEVHFQDELVQVRGALDMVFAQAALRS